MSDAGSKEMPGMLAELINDQGPMTSREAADEVDGLYQSRASDILRRAMDRGLLDRRVRINTGIGAHPYEYHPPEGGEETTVQRCTGCGWTEPDGGACPECGGEYTDAAEPREVSI